MKNSKTPQQRTPLGWREWLSLPDINLPWIVAKVDSGARTSALHAFSVEEFMHEGEKWVRFGMHPKRKNSDVETWCEAAVKDIRAVTDSGGHTEQRFVIQTRMIAGNIEKNIELTLTNRDSMSYRMLLGRTAMHHDFLVIPDESYMLGIPDKSKLAATQEDNR